MISRVGYPKGRLVSIHFPEKNRDFANLIAACLTRVGLKTSVLVVNGNRPAIVGKHAKWDIFVTSWGNSTLDPVGILTPKLKSRGRGNFSGYANDQVDNLLSRAAGMLDQKERAACYQRVQEIVFRDAPMIFGYAAQEIFAIRSRVKNFHPSASGINTFHDVYIENEDR